MTGAARGVWAGVLGSLLLISPAEAEAEPEAAPFPAEAAGRPGCCRHTGETQQARHLSFVSVWHISKCSHLQVFNYIKQPI